MIDVIIKRNQEKISQITISGHAGSAKHGSDLICAAVSASGVGVLNSLAQYGFLDQNMGKLEMQEGYINIEVIESNEKIFMILETLITILTTIAMDNKKYIKITKVEV